MHYTQPERSKRWRQTPRGRYAEQKRHALRRGVPFLLTFDEWWAIWAKSKKYVKRGNHKGCFVMGRHDDVGPYAVGNVAIIPFSLNTAVRNRTVVVKRHTRNTTSVDFRDAAGVTSSTFGAEDAPF